jgi:LmbE family N-acetylglucosaminyl deacetylase
MLRLVPARAPLDILCLGAHSDDIEIGAGGTVLTLLARHPGSRVRWVVFSADAARAEEARASAQFFLAGAAEARVDLHDLRDGFFPAAFTTLKERFEALKRETQPDLILTHTRDDHHQDHRLLAELTWNTFRDHLVLGYEIAKYDPDLGNPNVFVPLAAEVAGRKVAALMEYFATQRRRRWFEPETFLGLMRVRGMQAAAPSGLAEGFFGPKLWL